MCPHERGVGKALPGLPGSPGLSKGTEQGMTWWMQAGPRLLDYAMGSQVAFGGFLWVVLGLPQGWYHRRDLVSGCRPGGGQKNTKSWAFWEATSPVFLGSLGPWDPGQATSAI